MEESQKILLTTFDRRYLPVYRGTIKQYEIDHPNEIGRFIVVDGQKESQSDSFSKYMNLYQTDVWKDSSYDEFKETIDSKISEIEKMEVLREKIRNKFY